MVTKAKALYQVKLRLDYFLFKYYKPYEKFKKYQSNLFNLHCFNFFDRYIVKRATLKKQIIIVG